MDETRFWQVIEASRTQARSKSPKGGHAVAEVQMKALGDLLAPLPPADLAAFDRHLRRLAAAAYRWDLWAAVYWLEGGCGDGSFANFRHVLVNLGRESYGKVLADPEALGDIVGRPNTPYLKAEGFAYVARRLHETKTGAAPPLEEDGRLPSEPGRKEFDFDFDDQALMRRHLPRLTAKFPDGFETGR